MINDKTITCQDCCNFILCGIKQKDTIVFKCTAFLSVKKSKEYFKTVENLTIDENTSTYTKLFKIKQSVKNK